MPYPEGSQTDNRGVEPPGELLLTSPDRPSDPEDTQNAHDLDTYRGRSPSEFICRQIRQEMRAKDDQSADTQDKDVSFLQASSLVLRFGFVHVLHNAALSCAVSTGAT